MTLPRNIVPGRMLFITMRTHRRTFFFSPNDEVNQVINYLVAYASERHGVGISGMVWQSNHAHLLVNDHRGEVSAFLQTLNGAIARGLNALRGERGGVFERGNVHIMPVGSAQDALTALAYMGANPVASGCVEHGRQWLGIRSLVRFMGGKPQRITRPERLFRHTLLGYRGHLPAELTVRYELPLAVAAEDRGKFIHEAELAVAEAEEKARAEVRAAGKTFRGVAGCRDVPHHTRATSPERKGPGSGGDPFLISDKEEHERHKQYLRGFLDAYAQALTRFRAGDRDVVFPHGTWRMARSFGVAVEGATPVSNPNLSPEVSARPPPT